LDKTGLTKITVPACKEWAKRFAAQFEAGNFNNTLGTLRAILERGGLGRDENPAYGIKRLGVKAKELQLPEPDQFDKMLETVETAGARQSHDCADLTRFLAFSGCRISEARQVLWQDVDFERGQVTIGATGDTKNRSARTVDFNPKLRAHLEDMASRLAPDSQWVFPSPQRGDKDIPAKTFKQSLTMVRTRANMPTFNFHDCRHHFVSMCVMSGIDFMTIAAWVGHKDGGVLIGKVYGHLANEHRKAMAERVSFEPTIVSKEQAA
jgi:integrase